MGFLCANKEIQKDVSQEELKNEKFLRDIGLNNVYNLNPEISLCKEVFLNPEYYVNGAIKLNTGLTATITGCTTGTTGVYNLDYTGDIKVEFVITGDTNYTNYQGNLCIKVFPKDRFNPKIATGGLISGTEIMENCYSFDSISKSEPTNLGGPINVEQNPYWITHNYKDNLLYVSNFGSNSISIIEPNTNEVIQTLGLGFVPVFSAYDPVNNRLFIVEDSTPNIWVLDCNTNTIITTIIGIANFRGIVYGDQKIYVITSGKFLSLDCNTFIFTSVANLTLTSGRNPTYDPINNQVYVLYNDNKIDVVNCGTAVVTVINTGISSPSFRDAAFNITNNTLYLTDYNNDSIVIIDCPTNTVTTTLTTPTTNPLAIGFDTINNNIFYSTIDGNKVYRLNCVTNEIENSFDISYEPRFILHNYLNNTVYITRFDNLQVVYITANSIIKTFLEGSLPKTWAEYLIRPYYTFTSKDCNPGVTFNSWVNSQQLNAFQEETDYYFMTIVNPPTPILAGPGGAAGYANQTLITDRLYVDGRTAPMGPQAINGTRNYFILSSVPSNGQVLLILNGVQLTQGYDFELISNGFGVPPLVDVKKEILDTDWLLATYIAGTPSSWSTNFGIYELNTVLVDGITTVTTPSYRAVGDNTLNYNTVTGNYEFFTTLPIDKTFSSILTVNGVKLAPDEQYFVSTSFPGRIIFDKDYTTFNIGDVITILFVTQSKGQGGNDYGSLTTNEFNVKWSVPTSFTNDTVTGRFIIQAYNNDTGNLTNQTFVDYVPEQSNYESLLTSLPLNINFRFTVTFEATYVGYLDNKVITCSSAEGFFDTTNRYINNTY